ncbi:MAG: tyrosine-type recombinase/integrase [Streptosporangiaceae bacterium]
MTGTRAGAAGVGTPGRFRFPGAAPAWLEQFPARLVPRSWAAAEPGRGGVQARLLAPPFALAKPESQATRRFGLVRVLDWLEQQPGSTWQERWIASGADAAGNAGWRLLATRWLHSTGRGCQDPAHDHCIFGSGVLPLICGDVIRPGLGWLITPRTPRHLVAELARARDPDGFSALTRLCDAEPLGQSAASTARYQVAVILAAKGGTIGEVTVGDCVELMHLIRVSGNARHHTSLRFYQLLQAMGVFPASAPATMRAFDARGQLTVAELIGRYGIECQPVRDLLVEYLRERQPALDYSTLDNLALSLAKLFWRDLELHHPGISSLRLPPEVAAGWKRRIATKTTRTRTSTGEITEISGPRLGALNHLAAVRAFYLDIAQWAMEDPARWGQWAAPCPVRDEDLTRKKEHRQRKSRMDQRTRERMPVLPALSAAVDQARKETAERLDAARRASPGDLFTAAGQTLRRPVLGSPRPAARVWAEDPATGRRRNLTLEEHQAFWAWAAVEVLRLTGIRIEELTELSHHSLIQYKLPATGELIPLLHIAPSKTDAERLLVVSPELADVLSAIICRIRHTGGTVPLVVAYDMHELIWLPPMPLLLQRRYGAENRPIPAHAIRKILHAALAATGLTSASGAPLTFTPHDFRRLWITEAVMHGMPPHIAQLLCGHQTITATMGYKAVYPEEAISGHRAFIARRRAVRPTEEYRVPTDSEWEEFLGHFERRKVALGDCGRAYATSCIHEHSCERCPLLRVDPAQRPRLEAIRGNLLARITEAEREGWHGEAEGLKVSLAGAEQKLAQLDDLAARRATIHLGMPAFPGIAAQTITTPDPANPAARIPS